MYTILMYIHPANVNRLEMELDAHLEFTLKSVLPANIPLKYSIHHINIIYHERS
jgi:hypothetical protein